jgi:Domain of unknown function (DUF4349)
LSQRDLVAELGAARVEAPDELRERVRLIAATAARPPRRRLTWRRALVVAVPVAAAIAATVMLTRPGGEQASERHLARPPSGPGIVNGSGATGAVPSTKAKAFSVPAAPSPTRAQRYGATLSLRVADVSAETQRAQRVVGSLGGYVLSMHVATLHGGGSANLVFRVPRTHVAEAVTRLERLGTITGERVDVQDVQGGLNATSRTIARLQRQLRELRAQPASPARDRRLAQLTTRIEALQRQQAATKRGARYATIRLGLSTAAAVPPQRGHGPLHGLGVAFHWIGIGAVYAAALGLPLLALAALGWLGLRALRRRREDALLQ